MSAVLLELLLESSRDGEKEPDWVSWGEWARVVHPSADLWLRLRRGGSAGRQQLTWTPEHRRGGEGSRAPPRLGGGATETERASKVWRVSFFDFICHSRGIEMSSSSSAHVKSCCESRMSLSFLPAQNKTAVSRFRRFGFSLLLFPSTREKQMFNKLALQACFRLSALCCPPWTNQPAPSNLKHLLFFYLKNRK